MDEVKAGQAQPVSGGAAAEMRGAMGEFLNELKSFRENVEQKLQAQDKRMTMLDRKTAFRGRAPLSTAAETEAPPESEESTAPHRPAPPARGCPRATS